MAGELALAFADEEFSHVPFGDFTEAAYARDPNFGGPEEAEHIDYRRLRISVGNKPVSWKVRKLFSKAGKILPKGLKLYKERDVWLIAHAVSVADRGEFASVFGSVVEAVGYEAEFDPGLAQTIDLLPEPAAVRTFGGDLEVSATLGLDGKAAISGEQNAGPVASILPLAGGAKIELSASVDVVGQLSFGIWSPKILAHGYASSKCEWVFNRSGSPLLNTQLMFQTVLVPAGLDELKFRCRAFSLIRSRSYIPIPSRFETKWIDVATSPVGDV